MKHKKLTALVLCFTMLFSITSGIFSAVFAADSTTDSAYHLDTTTGSGVWSSTTESAYKADNGLKLFSTKATITSPSSMDYSGDIGKVAVFNEAFADDDYFWVLDVETPTLPWATPDTMSYYKTDFSKDIQFEIMDVVVLSDTYMDYVDDTTDETVEITELTLWYQVNIIAGTAEGFENGYWIMQNYLNEEDAYEQDLLILSDPPVVESMVGKIVQFKIDIVPSLYGSIGGTGFGTMSTVPSAMIVIEQHTDENGVVWYYVDAVKGETWPGDCTEYHYVKATDVEVVEEEEDETPTNPCAICGVVNCTTAHLYCEKCGTFDCGLTHTQKPIGPAIKPEIPDEKSVTYTDDVAVSIVDKKGGAVTKLELDQGVRTSISAWGNAGDTGNESYQWQICYDTDNNLWADIQGQTGKGMLISPAMVQSIIDENDEKDEVLIRCEVTSGETVQYSANIPVTVKQNASPAMARFALPRVASNDAVVTDTAGMETRAADTYSVVINYVLDGTIVADPYTATLAAGSNFKATVSFPTIRGYLPYLGEATESTTSLALNITNINEDETYTVTYKPTLVNYKVIHYQQNLTDDQYTKVAEETLQGLTKSTVLEVANDYPGFYALLYERPEIAADGSTEVEIYYDRNYYLVNFELDGGYGTEPIYGRYGAPIAAEDPSRAGYTFAGWSLNGKDKVNLAKTIAEDVTYIALWTPGDPVNYTVVYWRENADNTNYSYWTQQTMQATPGSVVSGSDSVASHVSDEAYFTYNDALTDKNVEIEGDGSTIINVYYNRNYYTIIFYYNGECNIEEHTHGTDCVRELICGADGHVHNADCKRTLVCELKEHVHTNECLICTKPIHPLHTLEDCYELNCNETSHDHIDEGCTLNCTHTHKISCYTTGYGGELRKTGKPTQTLTSVGNGIYTLTMNFGGNKQIFYYLNIGDEWYCSYNGYDPISVNCSHISHDDSCYSCGKTQGFHNHTIEGGCYQQTCTLEIHTAHTDAAGCYKDTAHTHTESCYGYQCGQEPHTHDNTCYRACTEYVHTHGNTCRYGGNGNQSNYKIYKVITAKYDAYIGDQWPTADDIKGFAYWTGGGLASGGQSSKVMNMTSNICINGGNKLLANYASTMYTLKYWFEHFDQTVTPDETTYVRHNDKIYKLSEAYSQTAYYGSLNNWGYKTITGMEATASNAEREGNTFHLYYDRTRHDLRFHNVKGVTKTVENIMYEQPLANYKDSTDNLLSAYVPTYPFESYEANPMVFKGWYTTPECFDGTEVDFATLTMPNSDLTLYAKWVPIGHTVSFYLDKEAYEAGTKLSTHLDVTVPHGGKVTPTPATPDNGDYSFVAWFYMDGNVEKAFDFANMRVTKDMQVYGKWSSNVLKQYFVYFKIQGTDTDIADPIIGSSRAGETKTFDAKGDADLYVDYRNGYFPLVKSHSMTLDIENDANNIFTFWYVQKDAVPYTVYYVAETLKDGENATDYEIITRDGKTYCIIATTYTNNENRKAVVTEKFKQVPGYVPDAYQKRLVVDGSDGAVKEIIFYYSVDNKHAYYKITHYTQNVDGDTWTEYASSEALGDIGTTYTADPMTIPGFSYDSSVTGTAVSGELTANGLELKLYYVRNTYPYEVRYLELGTDNELADPKTGTDKYGKVIGENAIDINGYTAVAPTSQTLTIKIEEEENVITFYYVEKDATINYAVVGPDDCGGVSVARETVKVLTGDASGSTATAASQNYKFVGWYSDEACTKQVSTEFEYKPTRPQKGWPDETTYYAKFELDVGDLTITKSGWNSIDENQSFIFTVTGPNNFSMDVVVQGIEGKNSVTIKDLPIGTYTVTEQTDWSWRYGVNNWKFETTGVDPVNGTTNGATITLGASGNVITFTNDRSKIYWLDGGTWCDNLFDGTNTTDTPSGRTKNLSIAFADIVLREETTDDDELTVQLA